MIDLDNKLLILQSEVKSQIITTLELFCKKFSADFILLIVGESTYDTRFKGRPALHYGFATADDLSSMTTFAKESVLGTEPVLTDKTNISGTVYERYVFIPVELPDGPRTTVVLGYLNKIDHLPENSNGLAFELLYIYNDLILRQSLHKESGRNEFLLSFGKALGEIRDCKQLFYLLNSSLKSYIGFIDCTVFILERAGELMYNLSPDSESSLARFPFSDRVNVTSIPLNGVIESSSAEAGNKKSFDFKVLTEGNEVGPFLKSGTSLNGRKGRIYNLYSGREIIGNCVFLFEEGHQDDDNFICIMPLIVNQIASVVMNIKSIAEIELKDRERDILQAINTGIAFNKDKLTLLKSINPNLRMLIDYSHHFVKTINDDQLSVSGLLGDLDSRSRFHPDYAFMVSTKFPISDQVYKVLLSNDPIVFDLDEELATGNALPLYMSINYECGIKKMAMLSLRVGSKISGIWVICLLEGQELSSYQIKLLKGISHQLSIAAENIKVADTVFKKNQERDFLSNISYTITSIRQRKDLDKLFNRTLKERFLFQEAVVMIGNRDQSYNTFLYTPEMYGADPGHNVDYMGEHFRANNDIFSRLMNSGGVQVFDMDKLINDQHAPNYIHAEYAAGVRTKIGVKLVRDMADIGAVFFNFNRVLKPDGIDLELYSSISYHLSTAISNVLLNEEAIKRETERELLFSLSTDIASIRNGNQLIRLVTEKLKKFLGFSYLAIGTINQGGDFFDIIQFDPETICRNHADYKDLISMVFPVNDGIINKILASPVPLSFELEELSANNELTSYLRISMESGIVQVIGVRFYKDNMPFGSLVLFFENRLELTSGKSSLISGLGNQISIAVANINANRELQQRIDEESRLMLFGAELRSVKDVCVLTKILKVQLREIFNINNFLLATLSEDRQSVLEIARVLTDGTVSAYNEAPGNKEFSNISKTVFAQILNSEEPVFFDARDFDNLDSQTGFMTASPGNVQQGMVGSIVKLGQQPIGFMLFEHGNISEFSVQRKLFENISAQIAIVLSNIISHQRIETQLKEIEIYKQQLEEEKIYLTEEIETIHNYTEIIGESTALKDTFRLISQVSPSDSTVLILGETGTGKELIARAIHNNSPRKNKIMVKVNCAALPVNLIESELFGHEKGSFTGATERRLGKFELANNGTLFLDEIGEMPVDLQVKLLRALQEREIERVGGKETIKVDVRIIAATNRNLETEIAEGRFRNDLFYRLNIFPISLPPLRERKQDIEQLAMHFIKQFNKNCGKNINSISSKAMQELMDYDWPGNIRELEHLIERSVLLANGNVLKRLLLPPPEEQLAFKAQLEEFSLKTIDENEKDYILKILKYCHGRIAGPGGAAQILGVPPTTLNSKIKRLGIKREHTM